MMGTMTKYENVSTREGFNSVVRHVKATISYVETVASKTNLADCFAQDDASGDLSADRIAAVLRMTLVDKFGYQCVSRNLSSVSENLDQVAEEISRWNSVDIVIAYHHPDLGLLIANPKDPEQLAAFGGLRKRELAVAYVGRFDKGGDEFCGKVASIALSLLEGAKVNLPKDLYTGTCVYKKAKKKAAAAAPATKKPAAAKKGRPQKSAGKVEVAVAQKVQPAAAPAAPAAAPSAPAAGPRPGGRMTPMYSVVVQNELFHNGNVEAWKRIIESYKAKYPMLEVYIYYDGERILNINSLFKWGKVKHGSTIQFAVAGTDIKDVAKLQRYLIQGASHMFEAFLHGPVSTVLKLF